MIVRLQTTVQQTVQLTNDNYFLVLAHTLPKWGEMMTKKDAQQWVWAGMTTAAVTMKFVSRRDDQFQTHNKHNSFSFLLKVVH